MTILKDVLGPDLKVVFCGTAVGNASARRGAYYAGPGNAFWKTLHEVRLTPHEVRPEAYESILQLGLGLTDLAKSVSGVDSSLKKAHFDREGLLSKILRYSPRFLAFTGKRAAEEFLEETVSYGLHKQTIGSTKLFVLPSPSGAARRFWCAKYWKDLSQLAQEGA